MDEEQHRAINERARRALARVAEQEPTWRAERMEREDIERWQPREPDRLVRKVHDPSEHTNTARPQAFTAMSPDVQQQWDRWALALIDKQIEASRGFRITRGADGEDMVDMDADIYNWILDVGAQIVSDLRAEVDQKLDTLREEIAGLRADMTLHSAIQRGEVAELKAKASDAA